MDTAAQLRDLSRERPALTALLLKHPRMVSPHRDLSESAPLSELLLMHVQREDRALLHDLAANPELSPSTRQAILGIVESLFGEGSSESREMLRTTALQSSASDQLLRDAVSSGALGALEALAHPGYPAEIYQEIAHALQERRAPGPSVSLLPEDLVETISSADPDHLTGIVAAMVASPHFDSLDADRQLFLLSLRSNRDGRLLMPYVEVAQGRFARLLGGRDIDPAVLSELYRQIMDEDWTSRLGSFLDAVVGHYNFEAWTVDPQDLGVSIVDDTLHASERGLRVLAGMQSEHPAAQENLWILSAAADEQQLQNILSTALTDGHGGCSRIPRDPRFLVLAAARLLAGGSALRARDVALLRSVVFNPGITAEALEEISHLIPTPFFDSIHGSEITSGVLLHPALPDSAQKRLLWRIARANPKTIRHYEDLLDWITARRLPSAPGRAASIYESSTFWIRPLDPSAPDADMESSLHLHANALVWAKAIEDQRLAPVNDTHCHRQAALDLLEEVGSDLLQGPNGSSAESWEWLARMTGIVAAEE